MPSAKDIFAALSSKGKITKVCATNPGKPTTPISATNVQVADLLKTKNSKKKTVDNNVEITTSGQFQLLKETHKVTVFANIIKITPKASPPLTQTPTPTPSSQDQSNQACTPPVFFDLDDTLIRTKSGGKFSRGPQDWQWLNDKVVPSLQKLQSTPVVIISNQAAVAVKQGSKSMSNIITKIQSIFQALRKIPEVDLRWFSFYCSTNQKGHMRKPETGIYEEFLKDQKDNFCGEKFEVGKALFIGDAAGRKTDFSDSDLLFAKNCGMQFKTPEEYFV